MGALGLAWYKILLLFGNLISVFCVIGKVLVFCFTNHLLGAVDGLVLLCYLDFSFELNLSTVNLLLLFYNQNQHFYLVD